MNVGGAVDKAPTYSATKKAQRRLPLGLSSISAG